jgi:N6-adenosine-specific RNA methylase IME4
MELNRDILRKLPRALRIEIEENARRKALTQSELAAEQQRILTELRKHKTPGKRTDLKGPTSEKDFSEVRTTAVVGKLFNESHKQVEKRAAIVEAAAVDKSFTPLVEQMDKTGHVDKVFKQLKIARTRAQHAKRIEHGCCVDDLGALAATGKKFPIFYAEPAWRFDHFRPDGGLHTSPANQYNVNPLDEIMRLPVAPLAAKDCALFLWCTWPHILKGNHVPIIEAWGFDPSACAFIWVKTNADGSVYVGDECPTTEDTFVGNGYVTRSNSEVVLFARKGSPMRLDAAVRQVVFAPVAKHSEKPEEVRRRIEQLYAGPYLELYARKSVPGWYCWGNEIRRAEFNKSLEAKAAA